MRLQSDSGGGVITVTVILPALLLPALALERRAPAAESSPGGTGVFGGAIVAAVPVGCGDLESALTDRQGRTLMLDSSAGGRAPALRPELPAGPRRRNFVVYPDGYIQNLSLGDNGFLTRDGSGPGPTRVRFAALDPDDPNQVWNFKMGPKRSSPGAPGTHGRYTLVVAPQTADGKWLWLLTAKRPDGGIVVERQKGPIHADEPGELSPGECWDFPRESDSDTQLQVLDRWDSDVVPCLEGAPLALPSLRACPLVRSASRAPAAAAGAVAVQAPAVVYLVLSSSEEAHIGRQALCSSLMLSPVLASTTDEASYLRQAAPEGWLLRAYRTSRCTVYGHVKDCCPSDCSWHSFACNGTDASWLCGCSANASGSCSCLHSS